MKHIYYRIGPHLMSLYNRNNRFLLPRVEALMPSLKPFGLDKCPIGERPLFMVHLTDEYTTRDTPFTVVGQFEWDDAQVMVHHFGRYVYELAIVLWWDEGSASNTGSGSTVHRMLLDFRTCRVTIELSANLQSLTDSFLLNNCLMMAYSFFAVRQRTLVMHASVVSFDGIGYLFLGKSGTGKSTHSRLWLSSLPGAELLNDDNPVVHFDRVEKTATVYGSPWSGKTPCYRAVQMPVGAFVRLAQASVNRIHRVSGSRAMALLLPSCSSFRQYSTLYNHCLKTVIGLADYLPVFQLDCLPDEAAAELCYRSVVLPARGDFHSEGSGEHRDTEARSTRTNHG